MKKHCMKKTLAAFLAVSVLCSSIRSSDVSAEEAAETQKLTQEISGPVAYNFKWKHISGSGFLQCQAQTKVHYEIVSGDEIASLDGAKVTFMEQGEAIIKATAEESALYGAASEYLAVSCNEKAFFNDVGEISLQYAGKEQGYVYKHSTGIKSCFYEYAECYSTDKELEWGSAAPSAIGRYLVKLNMVAVSGNPTVKFASMHIVPKELSISNLRVGTKVYDGTRDANLYGKLSGVVSDEDVSLAVPKIRFKSASAGNRKKVEIVSGNFVLGGSDSGNYILKPYKIGSLHGKVIPRSVILTVDNKSGTQGDKPEKFTYSLSEDIKLVKKPVFHCHVNKRSKPGIYTIRAAGAKAKNYKISYINGAYTVYERTDYDSDRNDSPSNGIEPDNNFFVPAPAPLATPAPTPPNLTDNTPEPTDEPKFSVYGASSAVRFDGIADQNEVVNDRITVKKIITNTGKVVCTDPNYEIKFGKSGWTSAINLFDFLKGNVSQFMISEGADGECGVVSNLTIQIRDSRHTNLRTTVSVNDYIIDMEIPLVTLDGINVCQERVTDATLVSKEAVRFKVFAIYGLTGKGMLSYKLAADNDVVDVSDGGWRRVTDGCIVIEQDFEGQVAIKAADALGNYSLVYTEKMRVDAAPPSVQGVGNGSVYEEPVSYSVYDPSGLKSVKLDGNEVKSEGTVSESGMHTLEAVDINGNTTTVAFEVKSGGFINEIIDSIKSLFKKGEKKS